DNLDDQSNSVISCKGPFDSESPRLTLPFRQRDIFKDVYNVCHKLFIGHIKVTKPPFLWALRRELKNNSNSKIVYFDMIEGFFNKMLQPIELHQHIMESYGVGQGFMATDVYLW
ncbi:11434_t:CDS:2, partial [Ambispora leptoticha]